MNDAVPPNDINRNDNSSPDGLVLAYHKYHDRIQKMYGHFGRASLTRRKMKEIGPEVGRFIIQLENAGM